MDVAVGFVDGSFGVWRFFTGQNKIEERYRHEKSSNGELIAMAFSYPYLLTATESVLISLYTFDLPTKTGAIVAIVVTAVFLIDKARGERDVCDCREVSKYGGGRCPCRCFPVSGSSRDPPPGFFGWSAPIAPVLVGKSNV